MEEGVVYEDAYWDAEAFNREYAIGESVYVLNLYGPIQKYRVANRARVVGEVALADLEGLSYPVPVAHVLCKATEDIM